MIYINTTNLLIPHNESTSYNFFRNYLFFIVSGAENVIQNINVLLNHHRLICGHGAIKS